MAQSRSLLLWSVDFFIFVRSLSRGCLISLLRPSLCDMLWSEQSVGRLGGLGGDIHNVPLDQ